MLPERTSGEEEHRGKRGGDAHSKIAGMGSPKETGVPRFGFAACRRHDPYRPLPRQGSRRQ